MYLFKYSDGFLNANIILILQMYTSLDIKCKVGNYFDFRSKKESYTFIYYKFINFFVVSIVDFV